LTATSLTWWRCASPQPPTASRSCGFLSARRRKKCSSGASSSPPSLSWHSGPRLSLAAASRRGGRRRGSAAPCGWQSPGSRQTAAHREAADDHRARGEHPHAHIASGSVELQLKPSVALKVLIRNLLQVLSSWGWARTRGRGLTTNGTRQRTNFSPSPAATLLRASLSGRSSF